MFQKYTGIYYRQEIGAYLFVQLQENKLLVTALGAGIQKYELMPVAQNEFIRKGLPDFKLSFQEDNDGIMRVTASGFTNFDYKKIAD